MGYKITIDGPSASGKGYISGELSKRLGLLNIDTGAMYRAFAVYCKENNVDLNDEQKLEEALEQADIDFKYDYNKLKVYLNNEDVSDKIRMEQIGMLASIVAAMPQVRCRMLKRQRNFALHNNIVMDGRDIGSVVFPEAELKIFLTADVHTRAERRYKDLILKNKEITFEQVLEDMKKRDSADRTRTISPLIKTEDMCEIDTTMLSKEQVLERVLELVENKGLVKTC